MCEDSSLNPYFILLNIIDQQIYNSTDFRRVGLGKMLAGIFEDEWNSFNKSGMIKEVNTYQELV